MGKGVTQYPDETVSGVITLDVGVAVATALKGVAAAVRRELPPPLAEQFALEVDLPEFPEVPETNDLISALLPHLVPVARFLSAAGLPDARAEALMMDALAPALAHHGRLRAEHGDLDPAADTPSDRPQPPAATGDDVTVATPTDEDVVVTGCAYLQTVRDLGGDGLGAWLTCGLEARVARQQGLRLVSNGQYRGERSCRFRALDEQAAPSASGG